MPNRLGFIWLLTDFSRRIPVSHRPIGVPPEAKRRIPRLESPEPKVPGTVQPWDQVWSELNKMEPPAIPVSPTLLASLDNNRQPPTIRIDAVPTATTLPVLPTTGPQQVEVDAPAPDRSATFIDLTDDDVDFYPPAAHSTFTPPADMMAAALAKRDARVDYQHRLRRGLVGIDFGSNSSSESAMEVDDDEGEEEGSMMIDSEQPINGNDHSSDSLVVRARKRLKVTEEEEDDDHDN